VARAPAIEVRATPKHVLGMPPARFLRDYWQRHPLLVRGAFAPWREPLTPEDLAGLACEELALARLVRLDRANDVWSSEQGPFAEAIFPALPTTDWTLLVQDVDKWDADVRALLAPFDFLPRWRLDDVMVSFAASGGSVGAHLDHYDVFLIQGRGRRRWQIDVDPNAPRGFREDAPLKLLAQFSPSHDWVLEPGDMLYLPPEVPHHGVALDPCMTFSVGLRAPSEAEMLADLADHLGEHGDEARRFGDAGRDVARDPALIDIDSLQRARAHLQRALDLAPADFAAWFGGLVTRYRGAGLVAPPPKPLGAAALQKKLARGAQLQPHPFTRLAWLPQGRGALAFADGRAYPCSRAAAPVLCGGQPLDAAAFAALDAAAQALALDWINRGHLVFARP
jgi:50S ribosomal protein L16 3-hydroxylase